MDKFALYSRKVAQKNKQRRYEQLSCVVPQKVSSSLDFASTDFLCLSLHDHIKKGTIKAVLQYGAGSSSTRLVSDHLEAHKVIEKRIAELTCFEDAHLFANPNQLHTQLLPALAPKGAIIYADSGVSHALKQAITNCKAEVKWFAHNAKHDLLSKIQDTPNRSSFQKVIVTESLFATTGEEGALFDLGVIAKNTGSLLYVDDSYSFGVYGKNGMGLSSGLENVDVACGTFGKAGGSFGSFATMPSIIKEYLMTCIATVSGSPPLAPAVIGAIASALDVIPDMDEERSHIMSHARLLRNELRKRGIHTTNSNSHIITLPVTADRIRQALTLFEEKGIYTQSLLPPFIAPGEERLRFIINASHSMHDIYSLLGLIDSLDLRVTEPTYADAYLP